MYRDLVRYVWVDETSQYDPNPTTTWCAGGEYYTREFTAYVPFRLIRRAPDLIDDFICKYSEEDWIWGITEEHDVNNDVRLH